MKHETEMANIAQGKAECCTSSEANWQVLYLCIAHGRRAMLCTHVPPLNMPIFPTYGNQVKSR